MEEEEFSKNTNSAQKGGGGESIIEDAYAESMPKESDGAPIGESLGKGLEEITGDLDEQLG
jgi:hypothetical protein